MIVKYSDRLAEPSRTAHVHLSPLLGRLRADTRAAHERIETVPGLSCLVSPDLTESAYVQALRALHAFHQTMHSCLPPLLQALSPESCRVRLSESGLKALEADIAYFGAQPDKAMASPVVLTTPEAALGAVYVVEGSGLGARVIGRAIAVSLGVVPGAGGNFFCGETADAARSRWLQFCKVLASASAAFDEAGYARVSAGALACFAALEAALGRGAASGDGSLQGPDAAIAATSPEAARIATNLT